MFLKCWKCGPGWICGRAFTMMACVGALKWPTENCLRVRSLSQYRRHDTVALFYVMELRCLCRRSEVICVPLHQYFIYSTNRPTIINESWCCGGFNFCVASYRTSCGRVSVCGSLSGLPLKRCSALNSGNKHNIVYEYFN